MTELEALNNFLMRKVADMNKPDPDKKHDSEVDVVFKHSLHKYHGQLLFTCADASVSVSDDSFKCRVLYDKYKFFYVKSILLIKYRE